MKEKEIEKEILKFIKLKPGCYGMKLNRMGVFDPTKQVWRKITNPDTPLGLSDLFLGVYGVPLFVEAKRPDELKSILSPKTKKTQRDLEQSSFLSQMRRLGFRAIYASHVSHVEAEIKEIESQIKRGIIRTPLSDHFFFPNQKDLIKENSSLFLSHTNEKRASFDINQNQENKSRNSK